MPHGKTAPTVDCDKSRNADRDLNVLADRLANALEIIAGVQVTAAVVREALNAALPAVSPEALAANQDASTSRVGNAFAAGFIEACRWPEPDPSDTGSTAFEIARQRYLAGRDRKPLDDAAIEAELAREGRRATRIAGAAE